MQLDPDYAPVWAALAGVHGVLMIAREVPQDSLLDEQREAPDRALALDPDLAETHARASQYYHGAGNFQLSTQHFRRARELDPHNPIVLSHQVGQATWQGRIDKAIEVGRQIVAQDPLSAVYRRNLSNSLLASRRLDEARAEILSLREMHPTLKTGVHDQYAMLLLLEQRFDEALAEIEVWPDGAFRVHFLAIAYQGLGRQREADAALQRLGAFWASKAPCGTPKCMPFVARSASASNGWKPHASAPLPLTGRKNSSVGYFMPASQRFSVACRTTHAGSPGS